MQYVSTLSCPDTVRNASRPKKSCAKSTLPSGVRGRFARSSVETRKSSPAPSASEAVMMGVLTQTKPSVAEEAVDRLASVWRTRVMAPDHVGARPQVRHLAQELHRVRLGLDRVGVGIVHPAHDPELGRLHLEGLALRRRRRRCVPAASTAQPAVSFCDLAA